MAGKVHVPVVGTTGKVIRPGGTTRVTTTTQPTSPIPTSTDIGSILRALTGQIRETQLFRDLADRIDLIDADALVEGSVAWQLAQEAAARAAALSALSDELQGQIDAVVADVADLSGIPDFDENDAYVVDDIVKYLGGLYRCILNTSVPSPLPTNATYWEKIGDYASLGEAVAALAGQYTLLETAVNDLNGDVTALTSRTTVLEASVTDVEAELLTKAAITYVDSAVADETSARTTAISSLQAVLQGNIDAKASISQLNQAVADIYGAEVTAFTNIQTEFDSVDSAVASKASSTDLTTAIANVYGAQVSEFTNIQVEFDSVDSAVTSKASITQLNDAKAEIYNAAVSQFTQIQAAFDEFSPDLTSYATLTQLNAAVADIYGASVSQFIDIDTRFTSTDAAIASKASMVQLNEAKSDIYGSTVLQFTNIDAEFTRVDGDITDLEAAQTVALNAAVSDLNTAIANAEDGAVATATQQVYTTLGGNQATVETKAQSWDGTAAQWSVKTQVGDLVGGIGLYNDGTETVMLVQADKFAIYGSSLPGNLDDIIPFIIDEGVVYIKEAVIQSLTVGKLSSGTLNADILMGTGRIIWDTGTHIKAEGIGFGVGNEFVEWYGPRPSGGNIANCSRGTAIAYKTVDGDMYTGGTLSAGILKTGAETTDLGATATITIGPFTTNGNPKQVAVSYTARGPSFTSSSDVSGQTGQATFILERSLNNGASWTAMPGGTGTATGTVACFYNGGEPGLPAFTCTRVASGSFTITDSSTSTANFMYRARLTSRTLGWGVNPITQTLGVISTEEA